MSNRKERGVCLERNSPGQGALRKHGRNLPGRGNWSSIIAVGPSSSGHAPCRLAVALKDALGASPVACLSFSGAGSRCQIESLRRFRREPGLFPSLLPSCHLLVSTSTSENFLLTSSSSVYCVHNLNQPSASQPTRRQCIFPPDLPELGEMRACS